MPALARTITYLKRGKERTWIVRFRMSDGRRIERQSGKTSQSAAEFWALNERTRMQEAEQELIRTAQDQAGRAKEITFKKFAAGFFAWTGQYSINRQSCGKRISEYQCLQKQRLLDQTIVPFFGDLLITEIKTKTVKAFRNQLFLAGKAGQTINHALSALKSVLEAAADEELIDCVPRIEKAAIRAKTRGILTITEFTALFYEYVWPDQRARVAALLAFTCGLRLSEIMALRPSNFDPVSREVNIYASYNLFMRRMNTTTKSGRIRGVSVSDETWDAVQALIANNPYQDRLNNPYIFYAQAEEASPHHPHAASAHLRPMEQEKIRLPFYAALRGIGIDDEERIERRIVFHSSRHYLNTIMLDSGIPGEKVRVITGHSSAGMTGKYFHLGDMTDLRKVQENMGSQLLRQIFPENPLERSRIGEDIKDL